MKKSIIASLLLVMAVSLCGAQTFDASRLANRSGTFTANAEKLSLPTGGSHSYRAASETLSESIFEMIVDMISELWALNTVLVSFDDYPYASDANYIHFANPLSSIYPSLSQTDDYTQAAQNQFYRFAADTAFFLFPGHALGNETRFEGLIWKFFGPTFQIDTLFPIDMLKDDAPKNQRLLDTDLRLGLQMSIFQTSPISMYWAICWERLSYQDLPTMNGVTFQLIVKSYPGKPLLLEWRGSLVTLFVDGKEISNDIHWDSHLELGIMVSGPIEAFGAWKYVSYPSLGKSVNGAELGIRYHL